MIYLESHAIGEEAHGAACAGLKDAVNHLQQRVADTQHAGRQRERARRKEHKRWPVWKIKNSA